MHSQINVPKFSASESLFNRVAGLNIHRKTPVLESLSATLLKETLIQVFSCEYSEIFNLFMLFNE